MTRPDRRPSRRLILQGAAVGAGAIVVGALLDPPSVSMAENPEAPGRYWFRCWGPNHLNGDYSSVEEVWAAPGYTELERIEVRYIGQGPPTLTPRERAAVDAAERAEKRAFPDPPGAVVRAMRLSARTPPGRLTQDLRAAGRPVTRLALELHPEAPQAHLLDAWLHS